MTYFALLRAEQAQDVPRLTACATPDEFAIRDMSPAAFCTKKAKVIVAFVDIRWVFACPAVRPAVRYATASNVCRTFRTSTSGVIGFSMNAMVESRMPCRTTASFV